jgi:hypothetical protein
MGLGFTGLALSAMLAREARASNTEEEWSLPTGKPHFAPKAKSVIWIFLNGGLSHLESFDPKPMLNKYAGKTINETPFKDTQDPEKLKLARVVAINDANGQQRNKLYPLQIGFKKYGQSGIEVSDWFPHIGSCVDDLAIIRSMYTTDDNHGAQTQFHCARHTLDGQFPNFGAWVHYGLGTLNDNLPQYISLGQRPYWNSKDSYYLGPAHDGIPLRVNPQDPLDFAKPAVTVQDTEQEIGFELVGKLNQLRGVEYPDDPTLLARIKSYELAFRMQKSIPEVLDFKTETQETQAMYGLNNPKTREFGTTLLATRRLVERGVRFVQIQHGGQFAGAGSWDAHAGLIANHTNNAGAVDQPVGALLKDLKRRGLLDDTLVVFASEFGRTPGSQGADGRDHHIFGFSVWMAGGGLKGGIVHGATDEIGFHASENRHYVSDVHATIMHQLGLDSRKMEIPGRKRLEIEHGQAIREIIA